MYILTKSGETLLCLNKYDYEVIALFDGERTLEDVIEWIIQKYNLPRSYIISEIMKLVNRLEKRRVIKWI